MSHIISPVEEISDLEIEPMPKKKILRPEKVALCGNVLIVKLKNSHILYCNAINGRTHYGLGVYRFTTELMKCLLVLGIITKEQMEMHIDVCNKLEIKEAKDAALTRMQYLSEKYKFKLTKEQLKKLS